jgi:hypothetical protein
VPAVPNKAASTDKAPSANKAAPGNKAATRPYAANDTSTRAHPAPKRDAFSAHSRSAWASHSYQFKDAILCSLSDHSAVRSGCAALRHRTGGRRGREKRKAQGSHCGRHDRFHFHSETHSVDELFSLALTILGRNAAMFLFIVSIFFEHYSIIYATRSNSIL